MEPIDAALTALELQNPSHYTQTAKEFNVVRSTLSRRHRQITRARKDVTEMKSLLSVQQEKTLLEYINLLTERGLPPTTQMVRNFASEISGITPGKNWISRFIERHKNKIKSSYLTPADIARKRADNPYQYKLFYELLTEKIKKYEIEVHNMYNMDEKGFLIGILNKSKRIYTKSEAVRGKLLRAGQDDNREWITVIVSICADGTSLPPGLIYQATSGNLQDSWLQDFNPKQHRVFFSSTATGWTNEEMGFSWLTTLFDIETKKKAGNGRFWRLLILDRHGSHINMKFLNWSHKHRILVAVFPPHLTYRLQPLDVSLFSPLSTYYSQELNDLICKSQDLSSLTKRNFFHLFWAAYDKAFTRDNILSGWVDTGLNPLSPGIVLNTVKTRQKQASRPSSKDSNTSALLASDWRKVRKLLRDMVGEVIEPQAK